MFPFSPGPLGPPLRSLLMVGGSLRMFMSGSGVKFRDGQVF